MKPLYWVCYTLSGAIARVAFQYRAYGQENIIEEGPAIMAANHQSYLDPPLVGITCRNELYFLARKTLFEKKLLGPIISRVNALPVDLSRGDLTAFRAVMNLLKEGHRTVIFPEGHPVIDRPDPAGPSRDRHDHRQNACSRRSRCGSLDRLKRGRKAGKSGRTRSQWSSASRCGLKKKISPPTIAKFTRRSASRCLRRLQR